MSGLLNITKHLKAQGIGPNTLHEAVVVDNNDPRKLCRIKARIDTLFDGIQDSCLPWCIPLFSHVGGAYTYNWDKLEKPVLPDKIVERSGLYYVPDIKSKVIIKFMNGDPHFPIWMGYTTDDRVVLSRELSGPDPNDDKYPNRVVLRMRNGTYLIIDTKTNEVFINSPGNLYLTVLGDVHETIVGNSTTKVTSKLSDIPEYVKQAPASYLERMKQNTTSKIRWEGLTAYKKQGGNKHLSVEGDLTMDIKGNMVINVKRNRMLTVDGVNIEYVRTPPTNYRLNFNSLFGF